MANNVAETTRTSMDQLREQATVVGHDIQELGRIAKTACNDSWQATKQRAGVWEKQVEDKVRQYPMRSVLIAAGVGALVGVILFRRRG